MNLLQQLAHMLGQHQQAQPHRQAPQARPQANQLSVQPLGSRQGMPLRQSPEDASYIQGPQGLVPMNADVAHFQGGPNEDNGLVANQQGYGLLSNDISHFRVPSAQVSRYPINPGFTPLQNSGGIQYPHSLQPTVQNLQNYRHVNPQVKDNGYYYDQ
jgi:hypothetical protein